MTTHVFQNSQSLYLVTSFNYTTQQYHVVIDWQLLPSPPLVGGVERDRTMQHSGSGICVSTATHIKLRGGLQVVDFKQRWRDGWRGLQRTVFFLERHKATANMVRAKWNLLSCIFLIDKMFVYLPAWWWNYYHSTGEILHTSSNQRWESSTAPHAVFHLLLLLIDVWNVLFAICFFLYIVDI